MFKIIVYVTTEHYNSDTHNNILFTIDIVLNKNIANHFH